MITKYDITYENNEIILIVNLDFNYEFANFNVKKITKNLKKEINILANKSNANKVKIIINGVLISTLLLTPLSINNNDNYNTFITNNTIKQSFNQINLDITKNEDTKENTAVINSKKENIKEEQNNQEVKLTDDKTALKEQKENNVLNENNTNNNIIKPDSTLNINEHTNENKKTENTEIKENVKIENKEEIDTNTYVTIYRSNGSIITLELEEYLIGVVGSEMPASFNIEALKAQAIVARTYTLKRIQEGKILTDNTSTQVYKDINELKVMWTTSFNKYYEKVKNAVNQTKGMVLTYNNNYIDAVYHSTSNGYTEDSIYVWGYSIPYLKSVESKTDLNASSYKRDKEFTFDEISKILNTSINKESIFILERNASNRVVNIKINDLEIKGTTFRTLLSLRSTDFNIEINEENVKITTYGYGHGVGMSQYGANGLANIGYSYQQILTHYYQNVSIKLI